MGTYTLCNLTRTPHSVPGDRSAQSVLRSCRLGSSASADLASLRCRASGHHRGRRGAAGPQATSLPAPFPGPGLSRLSGEKLGLDPGTGRKRQPNCSSIAAWGRGAPHLGTSRTFLSRSLSFGACKTFKDLLILIPRALELY